MGSSLSLLPAQDLPRGSRDAAWSWLWGRQLPCSPGPCWGSSLPRPGPSPLPTLHRDSRASLPCRGAPPGRRAPLSDQQGQHLVCRQPVVQGHESPPYQLSPGWMQGPLRAPRGGLVPGARSTGTRERQGPGQHPCALADTGAGRAGRGGWKTLPAQPPPIRFLGHLRLSWGPPAGRDRARHTAVTLWRSRPWVVTTAPSTDPF